MKARFASFNCKSIKRSYLHVRDLCEKYDIIALQEHWLLPDDVDFLQNIHPDFGYHGVSAVDTSAGILVGRPYGGVAIIWRRSLFTCVTPIDTGSTRVVAVRVQLSADRNFIVMSVYMPTEHIDNVPLFTECLAVISAVIASNSDEYVLCLGDFNADITRRKNVFARELVGYCKDQDWVCVDVSILGEESGTYTFRSDCNGATSWIDHCIATEAARNLIVDVHVVNDVFFSDHFPLVIECNIDLLVPRIDKLSDQHVNKVNWGHRSSDQIRLYTKFCDELLGSLMWPGLSCSRGQCLGSSDPCDHSIEIDQVYHKLSTV